MCSNQKTFIIDANAIKEFQQERVSGGNSISEIIGQIFHLGHIGLDDREKILSQWLGCCSYSTMSESLQDWVDGQIVLGKIRIYESSKSRMIETKLNSMGMPQDDRIYVHVANNSQAHSITTEDIDFHEPKAKKRSGKAKQKIKKAKTGSVCKYIKKETGSLVLNWNELGDALKV